MIAKPKFKHRQNEDDKGDREHRRREKALDEVLRDTFPASDPVSVEQLVLPAAAENVDRKSGSLQRLTAKGCTLCRISLGKEAFGRMNVDSKTVLVTGSTDGVGRAVALRLADQGARVLIHGRNHQRGDQVVERIRNTCRRSAVFLPADFSSLSEVRRLADAVRQECDRLDILINNAGIGSGGSAGKRELSQDGYELRFAVNYLAGFLLTRLLLPLLTVSRPARIVNVSSLGQHPIDFDDVMLTRNYTGARAYAQSKLAQIMFTFDLARKLDPTIITANCLHPATYMATTMVRQSGVTPVSTVEEGAEAILFLALSQALDGHSGEFYNGLRPARANAQAYDDAARERLQAFSVRLTESRL